VGKSALVNAILGEERVIVSDIPGTTRDVIDTPFVFDGQRLTLLDTAGIRRSGRIDRGVERHSVQRARAALERADVALTLIDATEPVAAQDLHIIGLARDAHTGIIVVVNKADLLPPGEEPRTELRRLVQDRLKFIPWAPIVFISALERRGLPALLRQVLAVGEQRRHRVSTGELNQVVRRAVAAHAPGSVQGRRLKVLYVTQAETSPPTFVFFVNDATLLHFAYQRYLENRLRQAFGFAGTAIRLIFKSRGDDAGDDGGPARAQPRAGSGGKAAR
jgi:GTP-binding protein